MIRNLNQVKYENLSSDFVLKNKDFKYQYAPLYAERLNFLQAHILNEAKLKWNSVPHRGLVSLTKNEKCIIIGTLYKEMKNKPNILKELAEDEENSMIIQPILDRDAKYIDPESDQLLLEDELQRIVLVDAKGSTKISENRFCTGIVIGVLGCENEKSEFEVEDCCFKRLEFEIKCEKIPREPSRNDPYIVFLSGIELGESNDYLFKLQLMLDFLRGDFTDTDDEAVDESLGNMITRASRLVIVGNSLGSSTQSKDMINKAKYLTKNYIAGSVSAMKMLDQYLDQLIHHMDVDIMPGEFDPSNRMVPQQPLHHSMLAKSISGEHKYNLHTVTNPYRFSLGQLCFLGTSGQFVDDIRKSTSCDDPIEIMRLTLECGHLGPTCPDTLPSYPFYGKDPLILNALPDVYFVGNQKEFKSGVYRPPNDDKNVVRLISLPKFSTTGTCVFFNLNTFESKLISF